MSTPRFEAAADRPALPDLLGAIDIGTNSVHMVIARVVAGGRFEVVTRHKEVVRLGSGAPDMKRLAADAIDRGIVALTRCRQLADQFGAELHAVATSAVREAENRDEFLRRADVEAGVAVDVISGFEEARLIHLGVLQALPLFDEPMMLCDIGGGSTELLFAHGDRVDAARSLKLGAIRMTERFFPGGVVTAPAVEACRRHVRDVLLPFARETTLLATGTAVASSGTAETLVRMGLARKGDLPQTLNGAVLSRNRLAKVIDDLLAASTPGERRDIAGMDSARADIIVGGALVLEQVVDVFAIDSVTYSDAALREGVLLDVLRRSGHADLRHLSDLRRQSVLHLMELCDDDPGHSSQVAWLADRLFEVLGPELGVAPEAGELLEAAALLANVGLFISHARHHQHSYYVIRNSEHLTGFTDREIELIAQVARYHRKSAPSERHPQFAALREADQVLVRHLAAILRVAIGLDRSHAELVRSLDVEVTSDEVVISVGGASPDADLSLELYSAGERDGLLAEVCGRPVRVVARG